MTTFNKVMACIFTIFTAIAVLVVPELTVLHGAFILWYIWEVLAKRITIS